MLEEEEEEEVNNKMDAVSLTHPSQSIFKTLIVLCSWPSSFKISGNVLNSPPRPAGHTLLLLSVS